MFLPKSETKLLDKMTKMDNGMQAPMSDISAIKATTLATNETTAGIWNSFPTLNDLLQGMRSKIADVWDNVGGDTPAAAYAPADIDVTAIVAELKVLAQSAIKNRNQNFTNVTGLANMLMELHPLQLMAMPNFFATGGMARGTDTVPAMLTPGEFVMKKSAVDKYGVGFMRSLNNGASPTSRSRGVQYLHDGGSAVGGGGGLFAGVGDIVSSISDSLSAFTQAFSLFSGLSSMLSNTFNSMADMNITHYININGSLAIPGFSQEDIDGIIANISNGVTRGVDEKIKQAFAKRDTDNENRT